MKRNSHPFPYDFVLLFLFCILANGTGLQADSFEIRGGGIITGKLLNNPNSNILQIRTNDGVEMEIASSKLKPPALIAADVEEAYKSSLVGKEDTAALHRAISLECVSRNQTALSYAHRERVVELEPSKENWAALGGYGEDKISGEWVRRDVLYKRKGMVSLPGNKWDTPQSKAITDFDKKQKEDIAEINGLIDRNLRNLTQRGPTGVQAAEFFNTLVDPVAMEKVFKLDNRLAIKKIYELLQKDTSRTEWYMGLLAKMPENSANSVFVEIAMNATNSQLVNQALELLERTEASRDYAFHSFLSVIRNPISKPGVVDRAGSNLQGFVDKRAIPTLINRLVTILKITSIKQATNSISSDGGISQTMGNATVESKNLVKHPTVLSALLFVVDGVNYEYNIPEWSIWYANTFAKFNMDLRRDE